MNYTNGPISLGGAYFVIDHPNATNNVSGAVGGASTSIGDDYSSVFFYRIDGGVRRQRIVAAGVNYAFSAVTM